METTKIYTLLFKGKLLDLAEEKAADFPAEIVKVWEFQHDAYTGAAALAVGKRLAEERLGAAFGTDADTLAIAKGLYAAEHLVKGWDWKTEDGSAMPVTAENKAALPPVVLKQFWLKVVRGSYPTDEELEALKLPLEKRSQPSTEAAA